MKTTFSSSFTNPSFSSSVIGVDRFRLLWKGWSVKVMSLLLVVMVGGDLFGQVSPQTFTTSGTWTCPSGVTSVQVQCWGGGGAGGSAVGTSTNSRRAAAGGGAGGAYAMSTINVTPGTVYTVTVGTGGVAVNTNGVATSGGDSWFSTNTTIIAKGGSGANSLVCTTSSDLTSSGGLGTTTGSIGTTVYKGGNGASGTSPSGSGFSGGGGSSAGTSSDGNSATDYAAAAAVTNGGIGGLGRSSSGGNGSGPTSGIGGGGGGAWAAGSTTQRTGGSGANGRIVLTWTVTSTPTIAISNGTIAAGTPNNGQTNVILQRYNMAVTTADATLTGLTVTTAGTYASADLTNLKCWYQTSSTFNSGSATLLSTKTTSLSAGSHVFPLFTSQTISSNNTGYIFVTADIASGATNGNTINIASNAFSNITFSTGAKTGTDPVAAGGLQTITVIAAASAPTLTAASSSTVDGAFNVTFTDDAAWRAAITSITVDGVTLTAGYSVTTGQITFTPSSSIPTSLLQSNGSKSIIVTATGYPYATVSQTIGFGAATKLGITTQPTAPASNGAVLATQPVVKIQDQYGNTVTTSSTSVTAAKSDAGSWTLGGTTSLAATSGVVTFASLTATSTAAVSNASLAFTSSGLTASGNSSAFNIPVPIFAPANDFCSSPTALTIDGSSINGTTVSATYTTLTSEPYSAFSDVWYMITPLSTGNVVVSLNTLTTDYDLYAFSSCPSSAVSNLTNLTAISTSSTSESLIIAVTSGITYYLRVVNTTSNSGSEFTISASQIIAGWDFTGIGSTSISVHPASFFNGSLVTTSGANNVTRGSNAPWSTGSNSWRTNGFKDNGISTVNTDYFQITLSATTGYNLSLSSIDAQFAGTSSFGASPGVSYQFAYSLDGSTFTLIGSPQTLISPASGSFMAPMSQIRLNSISNLQNIPSGTTIYLRYYASGQTTTGGWGFNSPSSGAFGLSVGGILTCSTPSQPSTISGNTSVCTGSSQTYSVTAVSGVAYTWSLPNNSTGSSSTNSISSTIGSAGSGTITVTPYNSASGCFSYTGASRSLAITINSLPSTPAATDASRCGTGTVTISATPSTNETIDWYAAPSGGTALASGSSSSTLTFTTPSISSTTIYYAEARNLTTGCTSATRTAVTATVNALPSAPTANNASRCGTGTVSISATPSTNETMDWYAAANGGTALASGTSASTLTYTTPSISSTTIYYAEARNLTTGCESVTRTAVTATVNADNTASVASSTPTLCISTPLTAITHTTTGATGIGTATTLPAGVTATWISNIITISGTPTQSGTFNYSIPLTGGCGSVNATGTITVIPANTVETSSSTPTLFVNTPLTSITHATSGATNIGTATGLPAGVSASWANDIITISGTPTSVGTFTYSIPLTGGCGSAYATGTITVVDAYTWTGAVSSLWSTSGNWSPNGVPTSANNVNIPASSTNELEVLSSLTIDANATFTLKSNAKLTLNGIITNNGTFTIENGATLVQTGSGNNSGNGSYNVKQNVTGSGVTVNGLITPNGRFWYMGPALSNATSTAFLASAGNQLWQWNESNFSYAPVTSGNLIQGKSYVLRSGQTTETINFSGTGLSNGTVPITGLTRTGTAHQFRGCHLVSNPYPSYLDWELIDKTNLSPTMYIRTASANSIDVLETYNADDHFGTSISGPALTKFIAPMQGFWVKVAADTQTGSMTMTNAMRSHQPTGSGLRSTPQDFPAFLRFNMLDGQNKDQIILFMTPNATSGIDSHDSEKMSASGYAQFYSTVNTKKLVINGMKNVKAKTSVPLTLEMPSSKSYTFQAEEFNIEDGLILLEDKQEGVIQDLTINPTYSFFGNAGTNATRFVVHFQLANAPILVGGPMELESLGSDELTSENIQIVSNNQGTIIIRMDEGFKPEGSVRIFEASGRLVEQSDFNDQETTIYLNEQAGMYFVEVAAGKLMVKKKIVIN